MAEEWEFRHIGLIVKSTDEAVKFYNSLGMTISRKPSNWTSEIFKDYKIYGKTPSSSIVNRISFVQHGKFEIEVLQPIEGDSLPKEFLENHGEGINHISFFVSNLDEIEAKMAALNIPVVFSASMETGRFAYFDTRKIGNIMLELVEMNQTK